MGCKICSLHEKKICVPNKFEIIELNKREFNTQTKYFKVYTFRLGRQLWLKPVGATKPGYVPALSQQLTSLETGNELTNDTGQT
jgi:predicted membrane metal-binding protein